MFRLFLCINSLLLLFPTNSWAVAVPVAAKKAVKIQKKHKRSYWSFKRPRYLQPRSTNTAFSKLSLKKHSLKRIRCEGPDLGGTIAILAILVLIWAIPTGIIVLIGALAGITWLWILGLILFLAPIALLLILFLVLGISGGF